MGWEPKAKTAEEATWRLARHAVRTLLPASCGKHASLFEAYHGSYYRSTERDANANPRAPLRRQKIERPSGVSCLSF
jgi:hypothetical protein